MPFSYVLSSVDTCLTMEKSDNSQTEMKEIVLHSFATKRDGPP